MGCHGIKSVGSTEDILAKPTHSTTADPQVVVIISAACSCHACPTSVALACWAFVFFFFLLLFLVFVEHGDEQIDHVA